MKTPNLRGLSIEDFRNLAPDVRKGLEQLSTVLSPFLADTTDALAGGLTLGNLDAIIKTVEVKTPAAIEPPPPEPPEIPTIGSLPAHFYITDPFGWDEAPASSFVVPSQSSVTMYYEGHHVRFSGYIQLTSTAVVPPGRVLATLRPGLPTPPQEFGFAATYRNSTGTNTSFAAIGIQTGGAFILRGIDRSIDSPGTSGRLYINNIGYLADNPHKMIVPPYPDPPPPPAPNPDAGPITVSLESAGRRLKSGRPSIVIPVGATEVSGTRTSEVVVPTIAWEHTKDGVVVKKIRGLDPGKRYRLTLLIAS